jgi:ribosome biogenesis GTPase
MAKGKGKQRKRIRKRRWDEQSDQDAVSREARKARGRDTGVGAPVEVDLDLDALFTNAETNGLVVSPYGVLAFVELDGEEVLCRVADELTDGRNSVLAPGDKVKVEVLEGERFVTAVRTRRNKLSRPGIYKEREQVFAANLDLMVVVASAAKPRFRPGLVDRYLIAAEVGGVSPVLVVNKMDLADEPPDLIDAYRALGAPVLMTSCVENRGIEELREALANKTSVLTGQSGVGKSSLLNTIDPELDVRVQSVSDSTEKGRHTTTTTRMYRLPDNIRVIDTPGIKQLALWGVSSEEVHHYFPDIFEHAAECKFRDCAHEQEPGCAVRAALEEGEIAEARYESYKRIRDSLAAEEDVY